jgi:hypothetical protein
MDDIYGGGHGDDRASEGNPRGIAGTEAPMITPESFVEFFRVRHGWKCHRGSAIFDDLIAFGREQARFPHSLEDLYVLFCVTNGIKPKLAGHEALKEDGR